jgi:hypothetical protein
MNPVNLENLANPVPMRFSPIARLVYHDPSMSTPNSFDDFLTNFRETVSGATSRLRAITPQQSRHQTAPDNWAPIEVLGHLIDSAANNHQRFVRAQFTDDLVFPGYEQNEWVSAQKYRDESWPDLIQLWSSYNLHLAHLAAAVPPDVLTKPRQRHNLHQIAFKLVDENEATTLEYFIRDYVDHLRHHLDQIFTEVTKH